MLIFRNRPQTQHQNCWQSASACDHLGRRFVVIVHSHSHRSSFWTIFLQEKLRANSRKIWTGHSWNGTMCWGLWSAQHIHNICDHTNACMHIYLKIKKMYKCLLLRCLLNECVYLHLPLGRAGLGPPPRPSNGHKIIFNWLRYCYFVRLRVNWKLCGPRCDIYLFMWDRKVYYATVSLTKKSKTQFAVSHICVGRWSTFSDFRQDARNAVRNQEPVGEIPNGIHCKSDVFGNI